MAQRSNYSRRRHEPEKEKLSGGFFLMLVLQTFLCLMLVLLSIGTRYLGDNLYYGFKDTYDEIMSESITGQKISQWVDNAKEWINDAVSFVQENEGLQIPGLDQTDGPDQEPGQDDDVKAIDETGMGGSMPVSSIFTPLSGASPISTPQGVSLSPIFVWGNMMLPLETSAVTSAFGYRIHPVTDELDFHAGTDFSAPRGTKIMAVLDGVVAEVGESTVYGNYIILEHSSGFETFYGHCDSIIAMEGERIRKGEVIAKVGTTGLSTGDHLHFEIRKDGIRYDANWIYGFGSDEGGEL